MNAGRTHKTKCIYNIFETLDDQSKKITLNQKKNVHKDSSVSFPRYWPALGPQNSLVKHGSHMPCWSTVVVEGEVHRAWPAVSRTGHQQAGARRSGTPPRPSRPGPEVVARTQQTGSPSRRVGPLTHPERRSHSTRNLARAGTGRRGSALRSLVPERVAAPRRQIALVTDGDGVATEGTSTGRLTWEFPI